MFNDDNDVEEEEGGDDVLEDDDDYDDYQLRERLFLPYSRNFVVSLVSRYLTYSMDYDVSRHFPYSRNFFEGWKVGRLEG